ncbi:MAG: hypothetical protein Q8O14_14815 [bacterium]|nr:hypothetical protein [bacterium]
MPTDAIDRWPSGERPAFFATPGAWEILQLLDRQALSLDEKLGRLQPFSTRDIRGAYFLTRQRHELAARDLLVSGEDSGRAERISARNLLRRAFVQAQAQEEAAQLAREFETIIEQVRASPPAVLGDRIRSVHQVCILASAAQPLPLRLQLLMEVQADCLAAAADVLQSLADGQTVIGSWPRPLERDQALRLLDAAMALQREIA